MINMLMKGTYLKDEKTWENKTEERNLFRTHPPTWIVQKNFQKSYT